MEKKLIQKNIKLDAILPLFLELAEEARVDKSRRLETSATGMAAVLAFAELPQSIREAYVLEVIARRTAGRLSQLADEARRYQLSHRMRLVAEAMSEENAMPPRLSEPGENAPKQNFTEAGLATATGQGEPKNIQRRKHGRR